MSYALEALKSYGNEVLRSCVVEGPKSCEREVWCCGMEEVKEVV